MFSLIITIVSIALVAAVALATLFYGGNAFRQGTADAQATKVLNQAQQLLAASELYYADKGAWPPNVPSLVTGGYLTSLPVALGPVANAWAAPGDWTMPVSGEPVFLIETKDPETCRSLNSKSYGSPGILTTLHQHSTVQCYGGQLTNLKVVVSRNGAHLETVAQSGAAGFTTADLRTGAIPADSETTAWLVRPSAGVVPAPVDSGSGEGAGGGTGGGTGDTGGGTGDDGGGTGGGATEPPPPPPVQPPSLALTGSTGANFYTVAVGESKTMSFTVANSGQGPATGVQASIQGAGQFEFVSNNCGTASAAIELPAGSSCTMSVKFTPTAQQFYSATLAVSSNDPASPHSLLLEGFGATPARLSLSTASLNLKTVPTVNSTQRVTLTNSGAIGNLTLNELAFAGSYVSKFAMGAGCTQGQVLAPNESCDVEVTFTPGVGAGASTPGTLRVGHSASASVSEVALAADSTYTPANFVSGQGTLSGNTLSFTTSETGGRSVGISRSKGKFTLAYAGTPASLNQLQFMVNFLGGGFYGLDFVNGQVATSGGTNVVTGSNNGANFGKPSLNSGDRVLMQLDFDNNTANWYLCSATSCGATPLHTMKSKVALQPYVYKYVTNNSASVTVHTSNVAGSPNPSTFHNGLPAN